MDLWLAPHDYRVRSLKQLIYGFALSPFGECVALSTETHLAALYFVENRFSVLVEIQKKWPKVKLRRTDEADRLISAAFENPLNIPILAVGTPFQLSIWEYLRTIPPATTMTYGALASALGRPKAARAVGQAVGANEIAVVIPCHRIVSQGKLTGYRWGLERKRLLLDRELSTRSILTS